jgi:hypothetical protein
LESRGANLNPDIYDAFHYRKANRLFAIRLYTTPM